MKLLGWMHRKFCQNSTEQFKDLFIDNSCSCISRQKSIDDEESYLKPTNTSIKLLKQTQKSQNLRNSFAGLEAAKKVDEDYYEGESESIFPGFLAIGTLGSSEQVMISDPSSTPTFALSLTEKEDEVVTQNDIKLINDELEKVLVAETNNNDDVISVDSSARNSIVSNGGRSSHVSIITLSGGIKPLIMEDRVSNVNESSIICPLQEYLFGTVVEHSETPTTKKEHRTSLGELFQKSKIAEDDNDENNFSAKGEKENKRNEREAEKSAINFMKEKLKMKRMIHASSKNSTSVNGGHADFASSPETKLNKILHMFRKKVHPQSSTATHKSGNKHRKNENKKKKIMIDGICNRNDLVHPEQGSYGNREHWIKTDADYLVLEL